jgi:hypothetical protein
MRAVPAHAHPGCSMDGSPGLTAATRIRVRLAFVDVRCGFSGVLIAHTADGSEGCGCNFGDTIAADHGDQGNEHADDLIDCYTVAERCINLLAVHGPELTRGHESGQAAHDAGSDVKLRFFNAAVRRTGPGFEDGRTTGRGVVQPIRRGCPAETMARSPPLSGRASSTSAQRSLRLTMCNRKCWNRSSRPLNSDSSRTEATTLAQLRYESIRRSSRTPASSRTSFAAGRIGSCLLAPEAQRVPGGQTAAHLRGGPLSLAEWATCCR